MASDDGSNYRFWAPGRPSLRCGLGLPGDSDIAESDHGVERARERQEEADHTGDERIVPREDLQFQSIDSVANETHDHDHDPAIPFDESSAARAQVDNIELDSQHDNTVSVDASNHASAPLRHTSTSSRNERPMTSRPNQAPFGITVYECNNNSKYTQQAQARILQDVNRSLQKLVRPWKEYMKTLEEKDLVNLASRKESMRGIWYELCEEVEQSITRLKDIRSTAKSGTAWHNNAGIYADLPLSYFQRNKAILNPSRLEFYNTESCAEAKATMDVMDKLLEADLRHVDYRGKHSKVKVIELIEALGIDLSWRGKLGSVDV